MSDGLGDGPIFSLFFKSHWPIPSLNASNLISPSKSWRISGPINPVTGTRHINFGRENKFKNVKTLFINKEQGAKGVG